MRSKCKFCECETEHWTLIRIDYPKWKHIFRCLRCGLLSKPLWVKEYFEARKSSNPNIPEPKTTKPCK